MQFRFKDRSDDIIWGQIKRASNTLKTQLELGGFTVLRNSSTKDEKGKCSADIFYCMQKKLKIVWFEVDQKYLVKNIVKNSLRQT